MRWGHIVPLGAVEVHIIIRIIMWSRSMVAPIVATILYHWKVSIRSPNLVHGKPCPT